MSVRNEKMCFSDKLPVQLQYNCKQDREMVENNLENTHSQDKCQNEPSIQTSACVDQRNTENVKSLVIKTEPDYTGCAQLVILKAESDNAFRKAESVVVKRESDDDSEYTESSKTKSESVNADHEAKVQHFYQQYNENQVHQSFNNVIKNSGLDSAKTKTVFRQQKQDSYGEKTKMVEIKTEHFISDSEQIQPNLILPTYAVSADKSDFNLKSIIGELDVLRRNRDDIVKPEPVSPISCIEEEIKSHEIKHDMTDKIHILTADDIGDFVVSSDHNLSSRRIPSVSVKEDGLITKPLPLVAKEKDITSEIFCKICLRTFQTLQCLREHVKKTCSVPKHKMSATSIIPSVLSDHELTKRWAQKANIVCCSGETNVTATVVNACPKRVILVNVSKTCNSKVIKYHCRTESDKPPSQVDKSPMKRKQIKHPGESLTETAIHGSHKSSKRPRSSVTSGTTIPSTIQCSSVDGKNTEHYLSVALGKHYMCQICQNKYFSPEALNKHMWVHTFETCRTDVCSNDSNSKPENHQDLSETCIAKTKAKMRNEIKDVKQNDNKKYTIIKRLDCSICGRQFRFARYLKRHMAAHKVVGPYRCDDCKMSFKDKRGLYFHAYESKNAHKLNVANDLPDV